MEGEEDLTRNGFRVPIFFRLHMKKRTVSILREMLHPDWIRHGTPKFKRLTGKLGRQRLDWDGIRNWS